MVPGGFPFRPTPKQGGANLQTKTSAFGLRPDQGHEPRRVDVVHHLPRFEVGPGADEGSGLREDLRGLTAKGVTQCSPHKETVGPHSAPYRNKRGSDYLWVAFFGALFYEAKPVQMLLRI